MLHHIAKATCALIVLWTTAVGYELRIGASSVDITPELGTPMQAPQRPPFEIKLSEQAHDPLAVKAVVLQVDTTKAAIVVCDLTSLPIHIVEAARHEIAQTTDLDPRSVMISATHTHTAPQVRARYVSQADDAARAKTDRYLQELPHRIAESVRQADKTLVEAHALAAFGNEDSISFNRRFRMKDGSIQMNPGKNNPELVRDIVGPDGPIDPQVGVAWFRDRENRPLTAFVNFSIHLDTFGGNRPSADLAYFVRSTLASIYGPQLTTIYAPSAAGNINHYDLLNPDRIHREKNPQESTRIGTILAAEVLRVHRNLEIIPSDKLRIASQKVRLRMPEEKGRLLAERFGNQKGFFDGEVTVYNEQGVQEFDAEVQVIALGDSLAWVGFPGELFVELGLELKRASPFRFTFVHSLANGTIGYVPDRKAYRGAAYEETASRCEPGSGERLVEAALDLLQGLYEKH